MATSLDCGCYIADDGTRTLCPSCQGGVPQMPETDAGGPKVVTPQDVMTVREIAAWRRVAVPTVKSWKQRDPDLWPAPWKRGMPGDPDLYLRSDVAHYCLVTGRDRRAAKH